MSIQKPRVWDERKCQVGEGPVATGTSYELIWWVDIMRCKVYFRNLENGQTGEYEMPEHVSFVIPCVDGTQILGTANGPVRRTSDGIITQIPQREIPDAFPMRWNDAKVAPDGFLFLGTMAYNCEDHPKACGLYRLDKTAEVLTKVLEGVTLSNGIDWTNDGRTMVYVDTLAKSIDTFAYCNGELSNRMIRWQVTDVATQGLPDGLCVDREDGVWVAFWNGGVLRRFDKNFSITDIVEVGVPMPTCCTFAGKDLMTLVITSACDHDPSDSTLHSEASQDWGKTFIYHPKIGGKPTVLFGAEKSALTVAPQVGSSGLENIPIQISLPAITTNAFGQLVGSSLPDWTCRSQPTAVTIQGQYCRLEPLNVQLHASDLFTAYMQASDARDWTYLLSEYPGTDFHAFEKFIESKAANTIETRPFAIIAYGAGDRLISTRKDAAIGMIALMRIDPMNGSIEVGGVNYSRQLRGTCAGTEAMYLLMRYVFDTLGYRRLEWKCDSLNTASQAAAKRYGFTYEGTFRQAIVYKGRTRDTAWFSLLDSEWPLCKKAFEQWLQGGNFDEAGIQRQKLESIRLHLITTKQGV